MRDIASLGTIRFGRFYARRIRRLLPASVVALIVTGVVYSAVAARTDVASASNAFKAAFLYVANWFFIHRSAGYFATGTDTNPVVHFWSLAVEEQFYFVWPILLAGLFAITRRMRNHSHRALQHRGDRGAALGCVGTEALRLTFQPRLLRDRHACVRVAGGRVPRVDTRTGPARRAHPRFPSGRRDRSRRRGDRGEHPAPDDPDRVPRCIAMKKDLYQRVLPALKPDLVIAIANDYLVRRPGLYYDDAGDIVRTTSAADLRTQYTADTKQTVEKLKTFAKKILILEPAPTAPSDPFVCLGRSKYLETCRFIASDRSQVDEVYRSFADKSRVFTANLDPFVCPNYPVCDPVIDGTVVRWDVQHLTPKFAESLAPKVALLLAFQGLITA
jgi:SGNH domain-containing protein/acyltransferase-like protein